MQTSTVTWMSMTMKKIDRLTWVERNFGMHHVCPWRVATTPEEAYKLWEVLAGACPAPVSLGIRTDWLDPTRSAGMKLPFLYHTTPTKEGLLTALSWLRKIQRKFGDTQLAFIVSRGIAPSESAHNCVALRADAAGDWLLEWDSGHQSQRDMEATAGSALRHRGCSSSGSNIIFRGASILASHPAHFRDLGWDRIYHRATELGADEVTFTKCHDGRVIIW